MIHQLLSAAYQSGIVPSARAHCDIPCKIYDPGPILIDALTVVRMIDILEDWRQHRPADDIAFFNTVTRAIAQKEEHAAKVKDAVRVIWGDYFKTPQFQQFRNRYKMIAAL